MILGAHEGIAGGVSRAFDRAAEDTAEAVQIFVRNPRGWAVGPLDEEEVARFRAAARRTGMPTAAHSIYLANHAAPDRALRQKSWAALADELGRCETLGIPFLVFHPGSNPDEKEGLALVAEGMERALDKVKGKAQLLVEITGRPGQLARLALRAGRGHPPGNPGEAAAPRRGLLRHLPRLRGWL